MPYYAYNYCKHRSLIEGRRLGANCRRLGANIYGLRGVKKRHLQSISPPLQQKGGIGGGGRRRDMRW